MKCINKLSIEYLFWAFRWKQKTPAWKTTSNKNPEEFRTFFWSFSIVLICSLLLPSAHIYIWRMCYQFSISEQEMPRAFELKSKSYWAFYVICTVIPPFGLRYAFVLCPCASILGASLLCPCAPYGLGPFYWKSKMNVFGAQNHKITLDTMMRQNW